MDPKKLLLPELLGTKTVAIKGYEPTEDFKTKEHNGYRVNISLQDDESPVFMEMISVKIKNLEPTLTAEEMSTNKMRPVQFKNLSIGVWNNQLTFSADDILPISK